jgi:hypothetical protein
MIRTTEEGGSPMSNPTTPDITNADPLAMQRTPNGTGDTLNTLLHFPCPACGQGIKVSAALLGQPCTCPHCNSAASAPRTVPGRPSEKVFVTPVYKRSRRGLWRRLKRFIRSTVKPVLIGLVVAAIMGIGLGFAARWLWD